MNREIDCRGLACPQPVLKTKKALDEIQEGQIVTVVDNPAAKENVTRLVNTLNCGVNIKKKVSDYYLIITKSKGAAV